MYAREEHAQPNNQQSWNHSQDYSKSMMAITSSAIQNMRLQEQFEVSRSIGSMAQRNQTRPHYYHLVCFDLIN